MVRVFLTLSLLISRVAFADVLFEGYSKVMSGGVHIGYTIAKYEFDNKKKQFIATTFLKTNQLGGDLTESLKTISTADFKPISYSYTSLMGKLVKTIDAKVEKNKFNATIKNGDKVERISKELPKGTFFSSVLAYVMLSSKDGLKPDVKYDYQAIAEEDATLNKGIAIVKNKEDYNGIQAFKVLNEFKNVKFISYVTDRGEVLASKSPVQSISTDVTASPSASTSGLQIPSAVLKQLFGDVPTGQINEVSKLAKAVPTKQEGIPQGKGIHLKGGMEPKPNETPKETK
jgi:hypothetical protein